MTEKPVAQWSRVEVQEWLLAHPDVDAARAERWRHLPAGLGWLDHARGWIAGHLNTLKGDSARAPDQTRPAAPLGGLTAGQWMKQNAAQNIAAQLRQELGTIEAAFISTGVFGVPVSTGVMAAVLAAPRHDFEQREVDEARAFIARYNVRDAYRAAVKASRFGLGVIPPSFYVPWVREFKAREAAALGTLTQPTQQAYVNNVACDPSAERDQRRLTDFGKDGQGPKTSPDEKAFDLYADAHWQRVVLPKPKRAAVFPLLRESKYDAIGRYIHPTPVEG